MQGNTYTIRAVIKIQTPGEWTPRAGYRSGRLYGFDTADGNGPGRWLETLTVIKNLNEPCGRFTLTFAPYQVEPGLFWSDLLPSYSLVEIWTQRYPIDQEPVLRMLGLTNPHGTDESYGQREPERIVQIAGQELSCIFVHQPILYLPVKPQQLTPNKAMLIIPDLTDENGRSVHDPEAVLPSTASEQLALLMRTKEGGTTKNKGMFAIDPNLAFAGASPVDAIDNFVRMVTTGLKTDYNPEAVPLINFQFPAANMSTLLFFDKEKAKAALFDPVAYLPSSAQLTENTVLWHLMSTWSDPAYQELFAVSRDLRKVPKPPRPVPFTSPTAMEIVFRKKPFAGRIGADGKLQGVASPYGTQFDGDFLADPDNTVNISDNDIEHESAFRSARDVKNIYLVIPQVPWVNSDIPFASIAVPLLDDDPSSPSRVQRYGPRLYKVSDCYLRLGDNAEEQRGLPDAFKLAQERQQLLRAWHRFNPLFYEGQLTLKGNTQVQVGKRIVDTRRDGHREYYCEGWTDSMTFGKEPTYTTRATVTRGWNLPG
jgi:hypothetical protein